MLGVLIDSLTMEIALTSQGSVDVIEDPGVPRTSAEKHRHTFDEQCLLITAVHYLPKPY